MAKAKFERTKPHVNTSASVYFLNISLIIWSILCPPQILRFSVLVL